MNKQTVQDRKLVRNAFLVLILGYVSHYAISHAQYSLLYDRLWIYILTGICFFTAVLVKNRLKEYSLILLFVMIAVTLAKLTTFGAGEIGILAFFIILATIVMLPGIFFKAMFIPVVLGYLSALLYIFLLNKLPISSLQKKLITSSFATVFIIISIFSFYSLRIHDVSIYKLQQEVSDKYHFAERLAYAIHSQQIDVINTKSIIENKLCKDIYKVKNNAIMHGFGDKVIVEQHLGQISITYENIPSNNVCAEFYATKPLQDLGFSGIELNGKPNTTSGYTLKAIEQEKIDNCYTGAKQFKIKFTGNVDDIKSLHPYIFDDLIEQKAEAERDILEAEKNIDVNYSKIFDINYSNKKSVIYH